MKLTKSQYAQIRRGPCWICNTRTAIRDPHHKHKQNDPYWEKAGIDPNQDWNVVCLCRQCHADWKHFVGEFWWTMRRDLCVSHIKAAQKKFKKAYKHLIPEWVFLRAMGMKIEDPYMEKGR